MKNVSRPASRSGPLAMATSGKSASPKAVNVSWAAASWPRPPSISTRSGQAACSSSSCAAGGSRRGGGVGGLAAGRVGVVGGGVVAELPPLAAVGQQNLDLVAALDRQRVRQQRPFLELVRHHDQARARLVVIELAQEGAQHL